MIGFKLDNSNNSHLVVEQNKEIILAHPFEFGLETYGENRKSFIFGRKIDLETPFLSNTIKSINHKNLVCHITLRNKILNIADKPMVDWENELISEINFAKERNARYVILHATSKERKNNSVEDVISNIIKNASVLSESSPLPFCMENSYEDLDFFSKLFNSLPLNVGVCLDVGHIKVHDKSFFNPEHKVKIINFLKEMANKGRTLHFHVHDNNAKKDLHWSLSEAIENGNDLSQILFVQELHDIFYEFNFILETRNAPMETNFKDFELLTSFFD